MTPQEMTIVREAMEVLETSPTFGVGADGSTMDDISDAEYDGRVVEDDANYHTCQKAWRLLEKLEVTP